MSVDENRQPANSDPLVEKALAVARVSHLCQRDALELVRALAEIDRCYTDLTQAEPLGEAPEIPAMAGTRDGLDVVSVRKGK